MYRIKRKHVMGVQSSLNMLRLLRFAPSILGATPKQVIQVVSSQTQFILFQYMISLQSFHRYLAINSTFKQRIILGFVNFVSTCFSLRTSRITSYAVFYQTATNRYRPIKIEKVFKPFSYFLKINSVCIILFGLIALRHVIVAFCSSKQPCDPLEVTVTYAFGIDFNF